MPPEFRPAFFEATSRVPSVVLLSVCGLVGTCAAVGAHEAPPSPLIEPIRSESHEAFISCEPPVVKRGGTFLLRCVIRFRGRIEQYNPFLLEDHKLPAQILIVSADGNVRRNLLGNVEPNDRLNGSGAWVITGGIHTVGREFVVQIKPGSGDVAMGNQARKELDLAPGEYFAQAVYARWINAVWPNAPGNSGFRLHWESGDEPKPITGCSTEQMAQVVAASEPVKFVVTPEDAVSLPNPHPPGEFPLRAEIAIRNARPVFGRKVVLGITFVNRSRERVELFCPYFAPGVLPFNNAINCAVLSSDGAVLGNLWAPTLAGSCTTVGPSYWLALPPGGVVASDFLFVAGQLPDPRREVPSEIPPGKYFLELRLHERFMSGRPLGLFRTLKRNASKLDVVEDLSTRLGTDDEILNRRSDFMAWERTFPGPEVCRSNRVELEVLPRTGN